MNGSGVHSSSFPCLSLRCVNMQGEVTMAAGEEAKVCGVCSLGDQDWARSDSWGQKLEGHTGTLTVSDSPDSVGWAGPPARFRGLSHLAVAGAKPSRLLPLQAGAMVRSPGARPQVGCRVHCCLFYPHFSISFFPRTENEGFVMRLEAQDVPSIFLLVTLNGSNRIIKDLVFTSKHWESRRRLHPVKCVLEVILFIKLLRLSAHQPLRSQSFWLEF